VTNATPNPEWVRQAEKLRALLNATKLSARQAAIELGLDETDLSNWCRGKAKAPQVVYLALQYLSDARTHEDSAAIAAACRAAAQRAAESQIEQKDFMAREALREQVELYTGLANRFEIPRGGVYGRPSRDATASATSQA
jgi:transcriptional regulator with XRE-family HTH domain